MTSVTEVGPGDWIKVRGEWKQIKSNDAFQKKLPRKWDIITTDGLTHGMWDIDRYAKAGEMRRRVPR
jgi:hypothetical protein